MKIQYKCEVCGLTFDKLNVLGTHIKRHHKIEVKDYYDSYLKTDINEGICCNKNCHNVCKFNSLSVGYAKHCSLKCSLEDENTKNKCKETWENKTEKEKNERKLHYRKLWDEKTEEELNERKIHYQEIYKNKTPEELKTISDKNKATKVKNGHAENWNNLEQNIKTKKERYGDENYNNRPKALETMSKRTKEEKQKSLEKQTKSHYEHFLERFKKKIEPYNVEYVRTESNKQIVLKCKTCGFIMIHRRETYNNIIRFNRNFCPICYNKFKDSTGEKELFNFIKENCELEIQRNDRKLLNGKELDIYIPNLKLAFEFNGTYWHMDDRFYKPDDYNKPKNKTAKEIWEYDQNKYTLTESKGIKIIVIKQYDWENNRAEIEKYIKTLLV